MAEVPPDDQDEPRGGPFASNEPAPPEQPIDPPPAKDDAFAPAPRVDAVDAGPFGRRTALPPAGSSFEPLPAPEEPAALPEPEPAPPPLRGPFDDLFAGAGYTTNPSTSQARTPWDPPAWGGDRPPLRPYGEALGDPYPGTSPFGPYGPYGETVAAPPMPRRSVLRPVGRLFRELAETVILALVIFLLVRAVVQNFQVEGKSMQPTLQSGWYLLVDKALYWEIDLKTVDKFVPFMDPGADSTRYLFRGPKRGDIIVFRAPDQAPGTPERDFIKRVIGLPGDTIEVKECTVYVNGQPLRNENYIAEQPNYTYPTPPDSGPVTVPKGNYFVLGDNRNNSSDSHSWGFVPKENIIGQAWIIYWPFHQMGLVNNKDIKPGSAGNAAAPAKSLCPVTPSQ